MSKYGIKDQINDNLSKVELLKSLTQPVFIAGISESGGVLLIVPVKICRAICSSLEKLQVWT